MDKTVAYMIYLFLLIATAACRKPYAPPAVTSPGSYLVVEGVINSGADSTIITLSKTVKVSDSVALFLQSNADVFVESEGGNSYPVSKFSGRYLAVGLNLDATKKYRLHIKNDGIEYASDYVAVKQNPPIDSITYKITDKGLQINSNTHDATNSTRYYRYAYEEAWRFHSEVNSGLIVKNGEITFRDADEMYYYCYSGDRSANIVLASSDKLAQDVIAQNPVTLIPQGSEKISIRYSILLKQYAISKDEYEFWKNIRKNTEQLGSIFDAQPSQLIGNIHCITNPAEPVIGYVSATNIQSKRIYISKKELPNAWNVTYDTSCENKLYLLKNPVTGADDVDFFIIKGRLIPTEKILDEQGRTKGYRATELVCTDCRVRGNINAPVFWEL